MFGPSRALGRRFFRTITIIKIGSQPDEPTRLEEIDGETFIRERISRKEYVDIQGIQGSTAASISDKLEQFDVFYTTFTESYIRVDAIANQTAIVGPGETP